MKPFDTAEPPSLSAGRFDLAPFYALQKNGPERFARLIGGAFCVLGLLQADVERRLQREESQKERHALLEASLFLPHD